jgi:hypothetical protein
MEKDLENLKNYIIAQIKILKNDAVFLDNLNQFLSRMISESFINSDKLKIKISRQLLCSIAIDLKSGAIPAYKLLEYFQKIDLSDTSQSAYKLFADQCWSIGYYKSNETIGSEYRVIFFPIKDFRYYVNLEPKFYNSKSRAYYYDRIYSYYETKKIIYSEKPFDKGLGGTLFWLTTIEEFNKIKESKAFNEAHRAADMLGLSHLDPTKEEHRLMFYIIIPETVMPLKTLKANSTMIHWENDNCGFLSCLNSNDGQTFCVSGYNFFNNGLREQVIEQKIDYDTTINKTPIQFLEGEIDSSFFDIQEIDIIKEGIKRFNQA